MANRVARVVCELIEAAGRSRHAVAQDAGLSPSTVQRICSGAVDPSVGTIREIAIACGADLNLSVARLSDPGAASAARLLLEDGYPEHGDIEDWVERWTRRYADDPVGLVEAAGIASSPQNRPGAIFMGGATTLGRIASAGQASGQNWALSGSPALTVDGFYTTVSPQTILWCRDPQVMGQLLADTLDYTSSVDRASLIIVAAEPELFYDSHEHDHIAYVAPIQALLDCFSLGGQAAADARQEALSW